MASIGKAVGHEDESDNGEESDNLHLFEYKTINFSAFQRFRISAFTHPQAPRVPVLKIERIALW